MSSLAYPSVSQTVHARPELSLLIASGRFTRATETQKQIRALLASDLDWAYVLKAAMKHRMVPRLYQTLRQVCPEAIPAEIDAYLKRRCQVNTLKNLFLDNKLQEILDWCQSADIPTLAYKGPELAKFAYGSLALRQFSDLDLLVHPQDFVAAQQLLMQHGFKTARNLGWEIHFLSSDQQVSVDLHRALLPDFFGLPAHFIEPTDTPLSPENVLLLLAVQLGKDCCHWKVCIGQICDISALLQRYPDIDFEYVLNKANYFGVSRFLWISLILVQDFLGELLPAYLQSSLNEVSGERDLANWVMKKIKEDTDHPEIVPEDAGFWYFFRVYNHRFYLQVRERPREKLIYCMHWLGQLVRMSLRPNRADRALIKLPTYLEFLYVPIHIIRLLLKYGKT